MEQYVEYDSNNSGGRWWLSDENWKALEDAGWEVQWYKNMDNPYIRPRDNGRWLGALASKAIKRGCGSIREAADEWERITKQSATDAGCPCCGQPHTFTLYRDGKYVDSGPNASYSAGW